MHTGAMVRELSGWADRYLPSAAHPDSAPRATSAVMAASSATGVVVVAAPSPATSRTAAELRRDTLQIRFSHAPGPQPPALLHSAAAGPRR